MKQFKFLLICIAISSCNNQEKNSASFVVPDKIENDSPTQFEILESNQTDITFQNDVEETVLYNYFNFMHLYMGAGQAIADFNNDGLQDIYFVSNLLEDHLYLNKGNLKFEDITEKSGITKKANIFSTGVTVVDINSDGLMDIYLCRSGPFKTGDPKLSNQLFINNGDLSFTEKAKEYGLDDKSHSTQALFLDYDADGDLDLYLVNTPVDFNYIQKVEDRELIANSRQAVELGSSDILFKNTNGKFSDISLDAGIIPEIAFGLSAVICDINNDNYPDIFVSNDFVGPDFLYENQRDGTFREVALNQLKHTSFFSMGSDVSDINNDGNFDIMVLDMSLTDYKESKTSMSMGDRDHFRNMINNQYNYQYMHNMLHLGNGNGGFSEVSQLAGLSKTDWSWSPLFVDFDHDGLKDLYVTNGVKRNVQDQDGLKKQKKEVSKINQSGEEVSKKTINSLMELLPQSKKSNYIFKNKDGLQFEPKNNLWLSEKPGISQGASFADFDNDGDLDIVMNNTNENARILKNLSSEKRQANAIIIQLKNEQTKNYFGIGATVELKAGGVSQKQLISAVRGYFSSSQCIAHFGLGESTTVEQIIITWPNGKKQTLNNQEANQKLIINYHPDKYTKPEKTETPLFTELTNQLRPSINHYDEYFDDFQLQVLIPHRLSTYGPKLIKGDLDNNNLEDIYFTSGYKQKSGAYYQQQGGFQWEILEDYDSFEKEETSGAIGDFNNDGINDLYIGCGSYQFDKTKEVTDYLLFGTADNRFIDASKNIPIINTNTSKVLAFDYDQDGDLDLFIGSRVVSGAYPVSPKNYILQNNKGEFTDVTKKVAPELEYFGMVTDADWKLENDKIHLVVVGEWTGIGLFEYDGEMFNVKESNISNKYGWWNTVKYADLDNDGDKDIIAGNLGLNYKFHASEEKPFQLYYGDLNDNGTQEIILAKEINGTTYPIRGKECSTEQMPIFSTKFESYNEFADQDLFGIYGEGLKEAKKLVATMFETAVFIKNGDTFEVRTLPNEAQFSTVNGIVATDVNKDGNVDLILAGNMYESEIETTKADASKGIVLINTGNANFKVLPTSKSGFIAEYNAKDLQSIKFNKTELLFVGNNNGPIQLFKFK